jgi:hypothetical protein
MINFAALNSATKYPQIETYHKMAERGRLAEERNFAFEGTVTLTEKVDGTNVRIIRLPGNDYVIGNREYLLYAKGDRIYNAVDGVVRHLKPVADRMAPPEGDAWIHVYYVEVYGGTIGRHAQQYTGHRAFGHRLFDVALVPMEALDWSTAKVASWRDSGGQKFVTESTLLRYAEADKIPLTPRLGMVQAEKLPTTLEGMDEWLRAALPCTNVALDDDGAAKAEGIVLRTQNRGVIAKARFADYARTLGKGR